ncbi:MAG: 30S ribosomal protein S16, partial [Dehalococcoidia bacterium]|nr:30S ribosomal protein S16 [Dehalococcoidia bacterium]
MMVKIRLRRVGAKNRPMYRVVVADSRSPRDGAFIEVIGHYNPLTDPETFSIDEERAKKWLGHGAQPTDTVARLLSKSGIIEKAEPSFVKRSESASPKTTTKAKAKAETKAETETEA